MPRGVLDDEVPVEEDRLDSRQQRDSRDSGAPTAPEPCRPRDRRSAEGSRGGRPGAGTKSASKIATNSPRGARDARAASAPALKPVRDSRVHVDDVEPARATTGDRALGAISTGLVGGVVEHLDLEKVLRVVERRDGVDQPLHDVDFVVDRELDGDARKDGRSPAGRGSSQRWR